MAESVRDSIVVNAGADAVLDTVADVQSYPHWQPQIEQVEVLDADGQSRARTAHLVIDAKVLRVACTLAYTYDEAGMHWRLVDGDGLARNDGSYLVDDLGDGRTRLTYELVVEPTVSLPKMIRRQIAGRVVDAALKGVKKRVEAAR